MKFLNCILCFLLLFQILSAQDRNPVNAPAMEKTDKPKLVVGIVVDQMRYDYISRYWNKLSAGGFKKLVGEGFFCRNTNYNYVPTYTGPGHASIYTGTTPSIHGIIANNWYDKSNKKLMYCTDDSRSKTVGATNKSGDMSPVNMLTTTFCDELKLASNGKSKVYGIALKDRGAILPAGHMADGAYWFDNYTGHWITSSFYMNTLPEWVNAVNNKKAPDFYLSQPWNTLLPIDQYTESNKDNDPSEGLFKGEKEPVFPHDLPVLFKTDGYEVLRYSPFGNTLTKDFAIDLIKNENLGKGQHTDVLCVSFSPPDYIGHRYGPNSIEIEDTYLRLDKDLAELLSFLDQYIGKENTLVFLTADHAAVENPGYLKEKKVPSGFFDRYQSKYILKQYLKKEFDSDTLIVSFSNLQIFLNEEEIERKKLNVIQVEAKIAEYMLKMPGVASTVTATALKNSSFNRGINALIQNGFHPKRSGNVVISLFPGWIDYETKTGTTHGSPYSYDTHVPLIWYGWKIKASESSEQVDITDIAPTISSILDIPFPNGTTGKPIVFLK